MKKNMGTIDRVLRLTIAIVFGVLYYMGIIEGTLGIVLIIIADCVPIGLISGEYTISSYASP